MIYLTSALPNGTWSGVFEYSLKPWNHILNVSPCGKLVAKIFNFYIFKLRVCCFFFKHTNVIENGNASQTNKMLPYFI